MANRIVELDWEETSGVDRAANKYEGFLVMKAEGGADLTPEEVQELLEKADLVAAEVEGVKKALDEVDGLFVSAPADIQKAAAKLRTFLDEITEAESKKQDKPGFKARLMAALLGAPATKEEGEEHDNGEGQSEWDEFCARVAKGGEAA